MIAAEQAGLNPATQSQQTCKLPCRKGERRFSRGPAPEAVWHIVITGAVSVARSDDEFISRLRAHLGLHADPPSEGEHRVGRHQARCGQIAHTGAVRMLTFPNCGESLRALQASRSSRVRSGLPQVASLPQRKAVPWSWPTAVALAMWGRLRPPEEHPFIHQPHSRSIRPGSVVHFGRNSAWMRRLNSAAWHCRARRIDR